MLLLLKYHDTSRVMSRKWHITSTNEVNNHCTTQRSTVFHFPISMLYTFSFSRKIVIFVHKDEKDSMKMRLVIAKKEKGIYCLTAMKYQCRSQSLQRITEKHNLLGLKKLWIDLGFRSYQDDQQNYSPSDLVAAEPVNIEMDCSRNY